MITALESLEATLTELFQREAATAGDGAAEHRCAEHVAGNARLTPAEQVDIYRQQFWLRHRDSLIEDYPTLRYFLGEDQFDAFARAFLRAHPPRTPSLRDLGARIVDFARAYEFEGTPRELAVDCVRYELAFVEAFDGPDPAPLDANVIAALPPEAWNSAVIVINPCVALLSLHYPVHRVRYALKAGEPPPPAPRADAGIRVALFRQNNVVRFDELSVDAFALLEALGAGIPLVPACERITAGLSTDRVAALERDVGGWFAGWARAGFFARIEPPKGAS